MQSYKKIQEEPRMVNATLHEESISGRALQILVTIPMVSIMVIEMMKKKKPLHPVFVSETRWRTAASIFQEGKSNSGVDKRQWESGKETVAGFSMFL